MTVMNVDRGINIDHAGVQTNDNEIEEQGNDYSPRWLNLQASDRHSFFEVASFRMALLVLALRTFTRLSKPD